MRCATRFFAALAAVAVVGYASTASAVQYIIDSNLSSITITGNIAGGLVTLGPQFAGSNVATFAGSIDATDAGATLNFTGAAIDAVVQGTPMSPLPGGAAGTAPADAGLSIGGLVTGTGAVRDFLMSVLGNAAFDGTNFDLADLTLNIDGGTLDYRYSGLLSGNGATGLAGQSASPTSGSGTLVGNVLTIPVAVALQFDVSGLAATVNLNGQVVAVAVPEPGTIAMLGMGIVGLVAVGRRRFRKA